MANIYTIYADHKNNITAQEFVAKMSLFLNKLVEHNKMDTYRITRMKLGFRSKDLGEWRIDMEFKSMQDLDDAMSHVLYKKDTMHTHIGFSKLVDADSLDHFLYRDYPDERNN